MAKRLTAAILVALLCAVSTVYATGTTKTDSGTRSGSGYAVVFGYYTDDASFHDLRISMLMEFQTLNGDGVTYSSCPYWPPSYCSWSADSGTTYSNSQLGVIQGSAGPIAGRFVVWADFYLDGNFDGTYTHISNW